MAGGRKEVYGPSIKYGTAVRSAALSRNVTRRVPASIIEPSVGHAEAVNGEVVGAYESLSRPTFTKTGAYWDAGRLSMFTIRRVTTENRNQRAAHI